MSLRDKWIDLKYDVLDKWEETDKRKLLLVAALVFFLVGLGVGIANAQGFSFARGETLNHMLAVCLKKQDAIDMVNTDSKEGLAAAEALWDSKAECAPVPVQGPTVGKVVYAGKIVRSGKPEVMRVVEIIDQKGEVLAYFLTSAPVHDKPPVKGTDGAPLILKPERNS